MVLTGTRLERVLELPREQHGHALASVAAPRTSVLDDPGTPMWAPPFMRAAPGGFAFLADPPAVIGRGVTPLGSAGRVVDFRVAPDGSIVVLEERNVLRRVEPGGREAWRRTGEPTIRELDWGALRGAFSGLLADAAGATYLVAERPVAAIARLGPDGALEPYADLGAPGAPPAMDPDGRVYSVSYDPATRLRTWNRLDPATGRRDGVACDAEASAALTFPIAADRHGRAYAGSGTSLSCVGTDGHIAWRFAADSVAVRDDDVLLSAHASGDGHLEVVPWRDGEPATPYLLALPDAGPAWRLVAATADGEHRLWSPGAVAVLDADGRVRELTRPTPPAARLDGWWLAPARSWTVDGDGAAYLPLTSHESVAVLRLAAD
ncbi:MAG TPA: hypothetical protein VFG79_08755 [Solirubrobacter sp.]|nr:hypothetical protein [Solirubrobacter sp.]